MSDQTTVYADDEFLTRDDICERLKISRRTLWEWERNDIAPPSIKIGGSIRFPKLLFDEFLKNSVQASG